jgi:hypothetical protein
MRVFAGTRSLLLISLAIFLYGCTGKPSITRDKVQEAWDDYNNPALLDSGSVVVFSDLPSFGIANRIPWSDIWVVLPCAGGMASNPHFHYNAPQKNKFAQ